MSDKPKCNQGEVKVAEDRGFLDKLFNIWKVTHKKIRTHELGYKCRACDKLTVQYNSCQKPNACLHCGTEDQLVLKYHDIVTNDITVETVKL